MLHLDELMAEEKHSLTTRHIRAYLQRYTYRDDVNVIRYVKAVLEVF